MIKDNDLSKETLHDCFRLLNSEIGNDLGMNAYTSSNGESFRLLNSEIGNDQSIGKSRRLKSEGFSSP